MRFSSSVGNFLRFRLWRVFVLGALVCSVAPTRAVADPVNLLAGKKPIQSGGVKNPVRLTDGLYSNEGDEWLTDLTSRFSSPRSFVEYSLGDDMPIRCAIVQADNNDVYFLSGSADGVHWKPLWRVGAEGGAGMRVRSQKLETSARFLRLSATGGDALYSVGEIAVYAQCPTIWPPDLVRSQGVTVTDTLNTKLVIFLLLAGGFLLAHRRDWTRYHYLMLLPVLGGAWMLFREFVELYPFFDQEPQLRAAIAFLAMLLMAKEVFFKADSTPHRKVVMGFLAVFAVTAFGSYYHFGMPQFFDQAKGRRTLVHTWDMRHYFPVAKYFRELRFDGLYVASLAAYIDNNPGFTKEQLSRVNLRDLRDAEMRSGTELEDEVNKVRTRFSAERWEEFKRDMKYFTETMGDQDYLGSMQDHGGNATPAWVLPAYFIFKHAPANEWTISLAGLIDPILVLFFFGVLAKAYGWRVMLYVLILWGVSDFYNFGSNLMGSTLRQDWLVALGLGACAIKLRRPFLGGVLIAYGGLIRAFPAMAAFFLAVPVAWFVVDHYRAHRRWPTWADFKAAQRPALRAMAGVVVCVVALFLVTSALFGAKDSWGKWYQKIEIHATGPSTNNVGLRNVMAFDPQFTAKSLMDKRHPEVWKEWERTQRSTFESRRFLHYGVLLVATILALLACRGRSLEQAAMIGLLTIPFYFYPSNYYCHYVFLIPLAVAPSGRGADRDRNFAMVFIVMAMMAIGQFFSLFEGWTDMRYTYQSILLLIGSIWILIELAVDSLRAFPLRMESPSQEGGGGGEKELESEAEEAEVKVKTLGPAPS